jgi:hypothetical protein
MGNKIALIVMSKGNEQIFAQILFVKNQSPLQWNLDEGHPVNMLGDEVRPCQSLLGRMEAKPYSASFTETW